MGFTIKWTNATGTAMPDIVGARSIDIAPNNDRGQTEDGTGLVNGNPVSPQSIRVNGGIGGGGIAGAGAFYIPISQVTSITVVAA